MLLKDPHVPYDVLSNENIMEGKSCVAVAKRLIHLKSYEILMI